MNKAIFLDRDGTINVDKNYLYKIEDWEFIDGVIEGLQMLQELGFKLIVIKPSSDSISKTSIPAFISISNIFSSSSYLNDIIPKCS